MTAIDCTKLTIRCPVCGVLEPLADHQHGKTGGARQMGIPARSFAVNWAGKEQTEPKVDWAVCRSCGVDAEIV